MALMRSGLMKNPYLGWTCATMDQGQDHGPWARNQGPGSRTRDQPGPGTRDQEQGPLDWVRTDSLMADPEWVRTDSLRADPLKEDLDRDLGQDSGSRINIQNPADAKSTFKVHVNLYLPCVH